MSWQSGGWLIGANWLPSPNFGERPDSEVSLVVIHNISLPPDEFGGEWVEKFFLNQMCIRDSLLGTSYGEHRA